jgi:hypothetical protein
MKRFKYVEVKIDDILHGNPQARDDDNLLFSLYLKQLEYKDFETIAEEIRINKIATMFKTVERVRRKLQANNPILRGEAWYKRHQAQEDFIQYAKEI